ncbi:hypothetical protein [Arcticibacterium luteifluviistationis]|uniref:Glycosyl hydrolase family 32 N-terminal domain-containing protein n=1 Tax=Arcticibacterium luteifluviistationis TaxID=1784714 RepID=A0A2Z4G7U1_9BACT|nr:hypothetical protein [Arcticibacterium luteifluviistationis]AWV97242.1 hypothetical protein DJ013_03270 [Arcticibacterium luteifluviistationis]
MKKNLIITLLIFLSTFSRQALAQTNLLNSLESPIIFKGNDTTAYRDPAVLYHNNVFYLFFTLVKSEDGKIYSYTAESHSSDLKNWSPKKILTPKDQTLDFSSPGNIIKYKDEWILCLQTYPRPDHTTEQGVRYGSRDARLFTMRSKDLINWGEPEIIKVKGPDVKVTDMGRMIDPYLLEDKDEKGKYWCFYKQNGVSMSYSYDLKNWKFHGNTASGENVCVLNENDAYILFHSPKNGIAIKRSSDLYNWNNWGNIITLGQNEWDWAKGRITAGTVLKLNKYIMFFHGSGPKKETEGDFDKNASIGIAWSSDLLNWDWPTKRK